MLISIVGNIGSGKTLLLTILAFMSSKEKVYSNYALNFDKYVELTLIELLDLKNNITVLIDEAYTWLESRTSMSHLNRFLSYIILQSRKRSIDIYITAQMFSSVDIRFREQSNVIVKCKRIAEGFYYRFFNVSNRRVKSWTLLFDSAKEYFDLYDTMEIIEPYKQKKLEFELLKNNPEKLINKIKELAKQIKPRIEGKLITHDKLKSALLFEGLDLSYEKPLYIYLKENDIE